MKYKIPEYAQGFVITALVTIAALIYLTIEELRDPETAQWDWALFYLFAPFIVIALGVTLIAWLRGSKKEKSSPK